MICEQGYLLDAIAWIVDCESTRKTIFLNAEDLQGSCCRAMDTALISLSQLVLFSPADTEGTRSAEFNHGFFDFSIRHNTYLTLFLPVDIIPGKRAEYTQQLPVTIPLSVLHIQSYFMI